MKKIAKDVYQIPLILRNGINCYLVEDVLIDSGTRNSFNKIKSSIKGMPLLNAHALTHGHTNHQGSSKLICFGHGPVLTDMSKLNDLVNVLKKKKVF